LSAIGPNTFAAKTRVHVLAVSELAVQVRSRAEASNPRSLWSDRLETDRIIAEAAAPFNNNAGAPSAPTHRGAAACTVASCCAKVEVAAPHPLAVGDEDLLLLRRRQSVP
jgi:hypothetical protein